MFSPQSRATRRRVTSSVGLAGCLAIVAACGSGSDTASTIEPPPITPEAPTAEPAPTATNAGLPSTDVVVSTSDVVVPTTDVVVPASDAATTTTVAESVPRTIEHQYGSTEVPAAPERIVALSEEFLLVDLLALGITPIASTSNDPATFGGVDPALTQDIEIMTTADFNVERLAALRPDLIVAYPVYIELVGYDLLSEIAPTVAIGDEDSDWRDRIIRTAEVFGVDQRAVDTVAEVETQLSAAREMLEGVRISTLSIFSESFFRVYVDGRMFLTQIMADLGVEFAPDAASVEGADDNGRIEISLERFGILDGEVLLLLQRIGLEDAAVEFVESTPLWPTLPAVQNDAVITLDRLGYPGATGTGAFAIDLAAAVESVL